jgi:hypothetical protein
MPTDAYAIDFICGFIARSEPNLERARIGKREILLITNPCEPSKYWIVSINIGNTTRQENR